MRAHPAPESSRAPSANISAEHQRDRGCPWSTSLAVWADLRTNRQERKKRVGQDGLPRETRLTVALSSACGSG